MSDFEIYPLAATSVNWSGYIEACQKALGISPTRGLDAARIDLKSYSAYLGSLSLDNEPVRNLRTGRHANTTFDHVFFSIILVADAILLPELTSVLHLRYIVHDCNPPTRMLMIMSGSMADWHDTMIATCSKLRTKDVRVIFNKIMGFFISAGFKDIWSEWKMQSQVDNTFTLERG